MGQDEVILSDEGIQFIASEEGFRLHWYPDNGTWAIGIGHSWNPETDQDFANRSLTEAEVWALFRKDAARYVKSVNDSIKVLLTQTQFDRLVSFAFNWGIGTTSGFPATSVVRLVNEGNFVGAALDLVHGKGPSGRPYDKGLPGVRKRRVREADPFKEAAPIRDTRGKTVMNFVSRSDWGAPPSPASTNITPVGVLVHWVGPSMGTPNHNDCAGRVRGIREYHMNNNGWVDVAYSALVCPHDSVFEGRGKGRRTAANGTNDGNQRYYAVCYLGGEGDAFTDEGRAGINSAIEWLGGGEVGGHRDATSTSCPGDTIYGWVRAGRPSAGGNQPAPDHQHDEPAPAGETCESQVFGIGDEADCVSIIQRLLNKRGNKLTDDGDFGPRTDAAVKRFQRKVGLEADGIVGPQTWAGLWKGISL